MSPASSDFDAFVNLCIARRSAGDLPGAIDACRQALHLRPDSREGYNNLGILLKDHWQLGEAIQAYQRAIEIDPRYPEAHNNLGLTLAAARELDSAAGSFRNAIALRPNYAGAHNNLGTALKDSGRIDDALACYDRAIALNPGSAAFHSNRVFLLHYLPDYDGPAILREHRVWNDRHARPLQSAVAPHANDPSPVRRLRIGYVSPDFREHPVGKFILPILLGHDRSAFEVFCYSDVRRPDTMTTRCAAAGVVWRNIAGAADDVVAAQIRADRIDILIDLTMHMAANRLLLFARKPAPVQGTFLAYPSTTGLDAMDFRITDSYLDPPGLTDAYYSERSMRLPDYFGCYHPDAMGVANIEVAAPPALLNGYITFGCLNNFCKVNPEVLRAWARILKGVPNSRLLLHSPHGESQSRTTELLASDGVSPARLEFVGLQSVDAYVRTYDRIDIGLDTFPYNGHTTSMDAVWMGVPVVTLVGRTAVGRAGLAQLMNLGFPEWIARDSDEYVAIATKLAADKTMRAGVRSVLRDRMLCSPLTDASRYIRNVEAVYREVWLSSISQAQRHT